MMDIVRLKKERFIREVGPAALVVGKYFGIDPKILLAQAALETGWGTAVNQNNYFNIKGHGVELETTEYVNGEAKRVKAEFRAYATALDSFLDYIHLIMETPRYQLAQYLFHDPHDYFLMLQRVGYATDPNYAAKCLAVYEVIPEDWLDIVLEELEKCGRGKE